MKRKRRITPVTHPAIPESRRRVQQHEGTQGHQIGVCPPYTLQPRVVRTADGIRQRAGTARQCLGIWQRLHMSNPAAATEGPWARRTGQPVLPCRPGTFFREELRLVYPNKLRTSRFFQACSLYFFEEEGEPLWLAHKGIPPPPRLSCYFPVPTISPSPRRARA